MIPTDNLERTIRQQTEVLRTIRADLLQEHPIDDYLNDIYSYPLTKGYQYISPQLQAIFDHIRKADGELALQIYHKLTLAQALTHTLSKFQDQPVSTSFLPLYRQWFTDVLIGFSSNGDEYYSHARDPFMKDFAVCTLRAIPVGGAWIVERSAIGRRFLVTGGIFQAVKCLFFVLLHMKGWSPFYEIHTVDRYIAGFTPEERERCYFRVAELLASHPEMKGLCAGSWFYDPALRCISPRLSYLIDQPMQHGAHVFRIGTEDDDIGLSLKRSPTRKALYRAGKYMPTHYLIIWPRKDLMKWATAHQDIMRRG